MRELIVEIAKDFDYDSNLLSFNSDNTLTVESRKHFVRQVDWCYCSQFDLPIDFIREFKDEVNWEWVSFCQKLSEDFIRECQDEVDWCGISEGQDLSEEFIREFKDKVDWYYIYKYKNLSEDFITEFRSEINWRYIDDPEFVDKFKV